jgi:hypothetical protein
MINTGMVKYCNDSGPKICGRIGWDRKSWGRINWQLFLPRKVEKRAVRRLLYIHATEVSGF